MSGPAALKDVTAVILAGGLGKRLRPVVSDRPKVLANVLGRPFLEHLFDRLARYGVHRAVLCAGFMADLLDAAYRDGYGDMTIAIAREKELLGTGGAVRNALPLIESDPVLVLNGDSYCTADLAEFYAGASGSERSMLLVRCEECGDYGRVETDADGRVTAYFEKEQSAGEGWVNAGVYLLSKAAIASIPAGGPVSIERDVFPAWIQDGILGVRLEGGFLDIGTPERLAEAEEYLAAHGGRA